MSPCKSILQKNRMAQHQDDSKDTSVNNHWSCSMQHLRAAWFKHANYIYPYMYIYGCKSHTIGWNTEEKRALGVLFQPKGHMDLTTRSNSS